MSTHPKPENHYARRFANREYRARLALRVGIVEAKIDPKATQQTHKPQAPTYGALTPDLLCAFDLGGCAPLALGTAGPSRPPTPAELLRLSLMLLRQRLYLLPEDLDAALALVVPAAQAARLWDLANALPTICRQLAPCDWAVSVAEAALEVAQTLERI